MGVSRVVVVPKKISESRVQDTITLHLTLYIYIPFILLDKGVQVIDGKRAIDWVHNTVAGSVRHKNPKYLAVAMLKVAASICHKPRPCEETILCYGNKARIPS